MSTIGDLTSNMIGTTDLTVRHEGSTVTGRLVGLHIETDIISDPSLANPGRTWLTDVHVNVTLGGVTLAGLDRDHAVEVIA